MSGHLKNVVLHKWVNKCNSVKGLGIIAAAISKQQGYRSHNSHKCTRIFMPRYKDMVKICCKELAKASWNGNMIQRSLWSLI